MFAEGADGGDGVAGAVEDHVGGVEVDVDVVAVEVAQELEEFFGLLLAGLHEEGKVELVEPVGDLADAVDDLLVLLRVLGLVGDEAYVGGDVGDAEFAAEAGGLLGDGAAVGPVGVGDEATGAADVGDGRVVLAGEADHAAGEGDAGFLEGFDGLALVLVGEDGEPGEAELDVGEAGGFDLGDEVVDVLGMEEPGADADVVACDVHAQSPFFDRGILTTEVTEGTEEDTGFGNRRWTQIRLGFIWVHLRASAVPPSAFRSV